MIGRGRRAMGRTDLPDEQVEALRKATFWEWFTLVHTAVSVTVIALVVGNSQAMRTAWIEDMLSLVPQIVFLITLLMIRHRPSPRFPYGLHRTVGVGHLLAGVALLAVGSMLAAESILSLIRAEHPAIGTVRVFGHTVWLGWLMVAAMGLFVIAPFFCGRAKAAYAPKLHNKLLLADGDMSKADWTTTLASAVGVLGVGIGWWWVDAAAAIVIAAGIVRDGFRNVGISLGDLLDQRARATDDSEPHPLIDETRDRVQRMPGVRDCGVRMRDLGQVFHLEVFVVPVRRSVSLRAVERIRAAVVDTDWKVQDAVIAVVPEVPDGAR